MNHILSMTYKDFQDFPFVHYWIIIDFMIMFLTLCYVYLSKLFIIESEITKNLYTLHFLQTEEMEQMEEFASPENTPSPSCDGDCKDEDPPKSDEEAQKDEPEDSEQSIGSHNAYETVSEDFDPDNMTDEQIKMKELKDLRNDLEFKLY
jgi:hypothetical protein